MAAIFAMLAERAHQTDLIKFGKLMHDDLYVYSPSRNKERRCCISILCYTMHASINVYIDYIYSSSVTHHLHFYDLELFYGKRAVIITKHIHARGPTAHIALYLIPHAEMSV